MNKSDQYNQKSGAQIVGASVQAASSASSKKNLDRSGSSRNSSMAPSDEFLAFWGDNVDPSWFEGKRFISPFVVIIVLLTILTFYLCGRLLFSPGEIEQIFFESSSPKADTTTSSVLIDESNTQEEKVMMQSAEADKQAEDKTSNLSSQAAKTEVQSLNSTKVQSNKSSSSKKANTSRSGR